MIKACVFDLGGVVLAFDFTSFYERVLKFCPVGIYREDLVRLADTRHDNLGCGLMTFEAYHQQFIDELGIAMELDPFREAWNDIFSEMTETTALIRRIAGVRRVMLSNTDEAHIGWVQQRFPEAMQLFDQHFFSHEIHERKPRPSAYHAVEQITGLAPQEHVMIDDMEENIIAAKECGWEGIVFTSAQQLEEDLRALGVEIN